MYLKFCMPVLVPARCWFFSSYVRTYLLANGNAAQTHFQVWYPVPISKEGGFCVVAFIFGLYHLWLHDTYMCCHGNYF